MWTALVVAAALALYGITDMIGRVADRREWRSVHAHDRFVRDLRPTPARRPYRPGGVR